MKTKCKSYSFCYCFLLWFFLKSSWKRDNASAQPTQPETSLFRMCKISNISASSQLELRRNPAKSWFSTLAATNFGSMPLATRPTSQSNRPLPTSQCGRAKSLTVQAQCLATKAPKCLDSKISVSPIWKSALSLPTKWKEWAMQLMDCWDSAQKILWTSSKSQPMTSNCPIRFMALIWETRTCNLYSSPALPLSLPDAAKHNCIGRTSNGGSLEGGCSQFQRWRSMEKHSKKVWKPSEL